MRVALKVIFAAESMMRVVVFTAGVAVLVMREPIVIIREAALHVGGRAQCLCR